MLVFQYLNQRSYAGIFLSYLMHIFLINSTTISNENIHYRSLNGSSEPMLLSRNVYNNIHQQLDHSYLPLITYSREYTYRLAGKILYIIECRNSRSATLSNIASFYAQLMRENITTIYARWLVFH